MTSREQGEPSWQVAEPRRAGPVPPGVAAAQPPTADIAAGLLRAEVVIVVAIAIGTSALRSVVRFFQALTAEASLSSQSTSLNTTQAPGRPWIDLWLQLVSITALVLPVALVIYLVRRSGDTIATLGITYDRVGRDVLLGVVAAAAVGGVGLAGYLVAREMGGALDLVASSLPDVWWIYPVLVLRSIANSLIEEVVLVGYLGSRVRRLGGSAATAVWISAAVRACYHLYQGVSGFFGNLAMGLVFGTYFQRTGRILPLIIAHALIDIVAFIGYDLLADHVSWL